MYTLTYIYTSMYQIMESGLHSYVLIVFCLKKKHECRCHVTLTLTLSLIF